MTDELMTVRVVHRFTAPPERVFDAWLDPEKIRTWVVGPARDDEILHIQVDARVGGSFSFLVRRQGQKIDHIGKYLEIDRPRRLVFTFDAVDESEKPAAEPSVVRIELSPAGGGTELVLTHERVPRQYAAQTETGWTKIIEALPV